jgi:hypothetical protein
MPLIYVKFLPEVLTNVFFPFILRVMPLSKGGGVMLSPARGVSFELEKWTHSESLSP